MHRHPSVLTFSFSFFNAAASVLQDSSGATVVQGRGAAGEEVGGGVGEGEQGGGGGVRIKGWRRCSALQFCCITSRRRSHSLHFSSRNTLVQTLCLVNSKEATSRKKGVIFRCTSSLGWVKSLPPPLFAAGNCVERLKTENASR